MYFTGEPMNAQDWILQSLGAQANLVIRDTSSAGPEAEPNALAARFNIVMGQPGLDQKQN